MPETTDALRCAWPDHPGFGLTHFECAVATRRLERGGGVGQMLLGVKADHAVGRAADETWIKGGAVLACPGCGQDSPRVHSLERAVAWQESHECSGRQCPARGLRPGLRFLHDQGAIRLVPVVLVFRKLLVLRDVRVLQVSRRPAVRVHAG